MRGENRRSRPQGVASRGIVADRCGGQVAKFCEIRRAAVIDEDRGIEALERAGGDCGRPTPASRSRGPARRPCDDSALDLHRTSRCCDATVRSHRQPELGEYRARNSRRIVFGANANDRRARSECCVERGLQRVLQIGSVIGRSRVGAQRDAAIVENRNPRRLELGNARRDERAYPSDRFVRERASGPQTQAHRRARIVRRLLRELGGPPRCDDNARVVHAVDPAQARFDISGETAPRLRIYDGLRRQHADRRERFTGARYVGVRNAGERKLSNRSFRRRPSTTTLSLVGVNGTFHSASRSSTSASCSGCNAAENSGDRDGCVARAAASTRAASTNGAHPATTARCGAARSSVRAVGRAAASPTLACSRSTAPTA